MSDRTRNLTGFAMFQLGWFACVMGGAQGRLWLGPACAAVILGLHLCMTRRGRRVEEMLAILAITAGGCALDAANVAAGFLHYAGGGVLGVPAWVVALWLLFASLFDSALRWLQRRPLLTAVCAGIGSPLSYLAGERLGAVTIGEPVGWSLAALGLSWAGFVTVALGIRGRVANARAVSPVRIR